MASNEMHTAGAANKCWQLHERPDIGDGALIPVLASKRCLLT